MLILALAVSCNKKEDEECTPPALATHLVGSWAASSSVGSLALTFSSSGELDGDMGPIFAIFNYPEVDNFTYLVNGETGISVSGMANGAAVGPVPLQVKERTCDTITFTTLLGDLVLTR